MTHFGDVATRRAANAKALAAFGVSPVNDKAPGSTRVVREGTSIVLFTVGYERRDGEGLFALLRDVGIDYLADIRDKPVSRRPDFRASALRQFCAEAGIKYGAWPSLGSTVEQRDRLHATGDLVGFHKTFRQYAVKSLQKPLGELASVVKGQSVALLCYERVHEECHRSVVADLIADKVDAGITAII